MQTPRLHLLTIPSSPRHPHATHPGRRFCCRLIPSRTVGRVPQSHVHVDDLINLLHGSDPVRVDLIRLENEVRGRDFLIFCYISAVDSSVFCSILLGFGGLGFDWGRFWIFEVFWMCPCTAAQPPSKATTIIRGRLSLIINNQTHLHLQSSTINSDWALLHFLDPEKFKNKDDFVEKYKNLSSFNDIELANLHKELRPHILRRVIKDVEKSLPPKIEHILWVEMSPL